MITKHFKGLSLLVVGTLIVGLFAFAPGIFSSAQARPKSPLEDIPVQGAIASGGTFRGTMDVVSFSESDGAIVANGLLTGVLRGPGGGEIGRVANEYVSMPVSLQGGSDQPTITCDILHLELGPLDLDLLGLVVHLDRIVLDID